MLQLHRVMALLAIFFATCNLSLAEEKVPGVRVTLLGMLNEWIYPKSEFGGAQTSDAAVTDIYAIKSKATLTTTDPIDQVLKFYCDKLVVNEEGKNLNQKKEGERITTDQSILVQNLSDDDENALYLISINGKDSSTNLVLSRPHDAKVTRIGWSNYRKLEP